MEPELAGRDWWFLALAAGGSSWGTLQYTHTQAQAPPREPVTGLAGPRRWDLGEQPW